MLLYEADLECNSGNTSTIKIDWAKTNIDDRNSLQAPGNHGTKEA